MKPFAIEFISEPEGVARAAEVRIEGFLDAHTVKAFEEGMEELLGRDYTRFIIDFQRLNYISSAGIGSLMVLLQRVREAEGDLVILSPAPKVFDVFEMLGFNRIFTIAEDRAAALANIG